MACRLKAPSSRKMNAVLFLGGTQYAGQAHLSADSMQLIISRNGFGGPFVDLRYAWTVTGPDLHLVSDTSDEAYVKQP